MIRMRYFTASAILATLVLSGCGSPSATTGAPTKVVPLPSATTMPATSTPAGPTTTPAPAPTDTPVPAPTEVPSIGTKLTDSDSGVSVTMNDVQLNDGSEYDKPKAGNKFAVVRVTIENNGTKEYNANPYYFKVQTSAGERRDAAFSIGDRDTRLGSSTLVSGGHTAGTITFEVPNDDHDVLLVWEAPMDSSLQHTNYTWRLYKQ